MKILPILSVLFILVFYGAIILDGICLRKKDINVNCFINFKKKEKNSLFNLLFFILVSVIAIIQILSIFLIKEEHSLTVVFKTVGLMFAGAGVVILLLSIKAMKDQWRIGINKEEKTNLITKGVYDYSRNPVNLAFYFFYFGMTLAYPTYILGILSAACVVFFHLETRKEEKYLKQSLGDEYKEYTKNVNRYV